MKLKSIILAFALVASAQAFGETSFYLDDGSVLTGFISNQPSAPTQDLTIHANLGTIVVPDSVVKEISDKKFIAKNALDADWVDWAYDNNAWDYDDNNKPGLYFATVVLNGRYNQTYKKVHLLKDGAVVSFSFIGDVDVNMPQKAVLRQTSKARGPEVLSGTVRRYTLRDSKVPVEGELVEVSPDKVYTVVSESGLGKSFRKGQILMEEIVALNPNQSFEDQAEYRDVLLLKNGTVEGYIIEKDYGKKTITILTGKNSKEERKFDEIVAYKKKNNNPTILIDKILDPGQIVIDDAEVQHICGVLEKDDVMIVTPVDSVEKYMLKIPDTKKLTIYANFDGKSKIENYVLVKLNVEKLADVKKNGKNKVQPEQMKVMYDFTYKDMFKFAGTPYDVTISRNGTTKAYFDVPSSGYYALYNKFDNSAIILDIR